MQTPRVFENQLGALLAGSFGWFLLSMACSSNGSFDAAAMLDQLDQEYKDVECACEGDIHGPEFEAECRAEYDEDDESTRAWNACVTRVIAEAGETQTLECLTNADFIYLECYREEDCIAFECGDGTKINAESRCDGYLDCDDESDEPAICTFHTCDDGKEIPLRWVCDGEPDCDDRSDESESCETTCLERANAASDACGQLSESVFESVSAECEMEELVCEDRCGRGGVLGAP